MRRTGEGEGRHGGRSPSPMTAGRSLAPAGCHRSARSSELEARSRPSGHAPAMSGWRGSAHYRGRMLLRLALLATIAFAAAVAAEDLPEWKRALAPPAGTVFAAKQEFVFSNESEPETLDPSVMTGVLESRLGTALFE